MRLQNILTFFSVVVLLASCVSARKYEELTAKKSQIEAENEVLKKSNTELTTANTELEAGLEDCNERKIALESDTTILGTSLRHMRNQYDKINELNEMLSSKNSKLLKDAADENRKLLEELDAARLILQ